MVKQMRQTGECLQVFQLFRAPSNIQISKPEWTLAPRQGSIEIMTRDQAVRVE
jgi:hypothetical protein